MGHDTSYSILLWWRLIHKTGESRPWSNPQTGHSGTITMLRSYKRGDMPCRDAKVNSQLKERSVVYVLPVCQVADGSWKFAAK